MPLYLLAHVCVVQLLCLPVLVAASVQRAIRWCVRQRPAHDLLGLELRGQFGTRASPLVRIVMRCCRMPTREWTTHCCTRPPARNARCPPSPIFSRVCDAPALP